MSIDQSLVHQISQLRIEVADWQASSEEYRKDADCFRAALQRIVDEADSDDGLTAWDGGDIARAALAERSRLTNRS